MFLVSFCFKDRTFPCSPDWLQTGNLASASQAIMIIVLFLNDKQHCSLLREVTTFQKYEAEINVVTYVTYLILIYL